MQPSSQELVQLGDHPGVGALVRRIADDMRTLASDEVELARVELHTNMRGAVAEAAVVVIGAVVGLIGIGLLCLVAVVALAPLISSLTLRLLLMSVVYLAIGGALAGVFAKKLKRGANHAMAAPMQQARDAVAQLKGAFSHGGPHAG